MPLGIGPLELAIVLVIILVIFGPKRLPGLGRSLGSGMREFKDSITSKTRRDEEEADHAAIEGHELADEQRTKPQPAAAAREEPEAPSGAAAERDDERALDGEVVTERRA